jgi:hypothetical protein
MAKVIRKMTSGFAPVETPASDYKFLVKKPNVDTPEVMTVEQVSEHFEIADKVSKTKTETIGGVKTFSSSPVVPAASGNTDAQNKAGVELQITERQEAGRSQSTTKSPVSKLVDDEFNKKVNNTGNETIAGVKTFSSSPVVPNANTDTQAQSRAGVELQITARQEAARSQSTTKSPISKLVDDELTILSGISESEAIQILSNYDPLLVFQGFANTTTATPAHVRNRAWIATASGTIFGITAVKGQVIKSNGTIFIAEHITNDVLEKYSNILDPTQFLTDVAYNFSNGATFTLSGSTASNFQRVFPNEKYTIRWALSGEAFTSMMYFYDRNKAFITNTSNSPELVVSSDSGKTKVFTTPANCHFIAFCRYTTSLSDFTNNMTLTQGEEWFAWSGYRTKLISDFKANKTNVYTKSESDSVILVAKNEAILGAKAYTDSEFTKLKATLPNNQIVGEGTQTPTVITIANGANLTITPVANDVIFPSEYAYKRRYLATSSSGSVFQAWAVNYPETKPAIIALSYWFKDSDIDAVYGAKTSVQNWWLYDTAVAVIHVLAFDNMAIKAAIGNTASGTFNYAGKMSGKWEVTCIDKKDGYSRLAINWFDIIYDPSYTKTNFALYHIFNNVMPEFNGKTIDFVGFTLVFGEKIVYPSVYPDAGGKKQYPQSLNSLDNNLKSLETNVNNSIGEIEEAVDDFLISQNGSVIVVKSGNAVYVRTRFDATRDLVQSFGVFGTSNFSNSLVGYSNVYLIDKTKGNTVADLTTNTLAHLLQAGDDVTPNNYNGTYIGGNHGCSDARLITVNSHGKTTVDIGSEWTDNTGRKYYILRIVNANQLWVISENIGTGDVWQFDTSISGSTLTHSAGATNTATMTIAANEMAQWLPATKNIVKSVYLDGKTEVTDDGVYYCNFIDIINQYDIVNPASALLNLIAAVGTTYTDTTLSDAFRNGASSVFNQILHRIQSNGALQIIYGWRNYQQINLGYMGFMQAGTPPTTTYPKLKLYMPKILPISDGVKTWDFRNIETYDVSANQIAAVTSTYWEKPLSPPERAIEYLCDVDGNKKIGFALGYDITKGIGKIRKDVVRDAWFFYTSRKMYPRGIDDKLNPVLANNWYTCVGYRIFFNAENADMGSASSFYYYELGKDVIVVLDYHTQVVCDNLKLPAEYAGMTINVVEKSDNITVHSDTVMQDGIIVSVGAGAYGFCVLKLT